MAESSRMRPPGSSRVKTGYFILEGLNTCATSYYLYFLFFHLQQHFGFGNAGNLTFAALNGFIYIFAAWYGGQFGQKYGYHTALRVGFCIMIPALLLGSQWPTVTGQVIVMTIWTVGMCFTWPSLEALISEGGPPGELPRMIGIYNMVWAGCGALTYFFGGALFERLGEKSLYYLPAGVQCGQLVLLAYLSRRNKDQPRSAADAPGLHGFPAPAQILKPPELSKPASSTAKIFLRMAWLSNPFAYIAINTIVAVIPEIARHLQLSPTLAGFCCSVWFFARLGAFLLLWQWTAWHYRFGWLLSAFIGLIVSFTAILLVSNLWVLVPAQLVFGLSVGLIYYSSLFYSMDIGETKGEHGGIHEAAIGVGIFLGPAVGATALRLLPQFANSGAWAVTGLLTLGLGCLLVLKRKAGAGLPR